MQTPTHNPFVKQLLNKQKIFFGPFIGELGWEIGRWVGFVRWFKNVHPTKTIFCSTRGSRLDLYHNVVDGIHTFEIEGDYIKYRSNMYRMDFLPTEKYESLISEIKSKYSDFYMVIPPNTSARNFFNKNQMCFNFTPRPNNKKVIKNFISKSKRKSLICISPRRRTDSPKPSRNWPINFWNELYENLIKLDKHFVFILGESSTIVRPPDNDSFIILDDVNVENTSNIGLTIEAIKACGLTVGQQSALPVLSNLLSKKTIMWGNEKYRHQVLENPNNTKCIFFEEFSTNYITNPKLIFETILKEST